MALQTRCRGSLHSNTSGANNTAIGVLALGENSVGSSNTALGDSAGGNVFSANNVICIGANVGGLNVDNSCFIGSIFGQIVGPATGTAVFVDESGKLGTIVSSKQFKDEIKPMDKASEAILELQPVTFRYKKELDPKGIEQFGLIAEDVAKVNPNLVIRDRDGAIKTVRYEAVNAMLLNEFLKEHRKNEEQEATIAQLKKDLQVSLQAQRTGSANPESERSG